MKNAINTAPIMNENKNLKEEFIMSKFDNFMNNMWGLLQLGATLGLAGIALKRNKDAYDEACRRIDAEHENFVKDLKITELEWKIRDLELKNKFYEEK